MGKYDVVIIGGGLAGLLCGNILSREGFQVCIVEKNIKLGGSLQTFGRKGCIFNTGLNYTESLDDGQILNQYFRYFGLTEKLPFRRLDANGFEIISFKDARYRFAMGHTNFVDTLAQDFPDERRGLQIYTDRIMNVCKAISLYTLRDDHTSLFNNEDLSTGAADYIRSVIKNSRLCNVLAGNSPLYAGHETKTPLFIHALINNSFIESAWRVAGGSHLLVNVLKSNILNCGGTILNGSKAIKLKGDRDAIRGVLLENGNYVEGKHFIAGIHPKHIFDMVEPGMLRKTFFDRINGLDDTMGMFTVYLVFKKNSFPYMNCNFYHYNQENTWIASGYMSSAWPQNYLFMNTGMADAAAYAESGSIITYMDIAELKKWEHTFTGDRGDDYLDFKQEKAEKLIDAVAKQFPAIRDHITHYYTSTPLTWRDYTGTRSGSAYGILKDFRRPVESMILPRTKIPNLYLTGQNTNVHGLLGVTISAVVTCSELIETGYLIRKIRSA